MSYFSQARGCAVLLGVLSASYALAAPPSIGTASARGSMRIDGSRVEGNATLFDGTLVETEQATTAVRLGKGVEVKLSSDSRGKLYRDRMVLEKGTGELTASNFMLQANTLKIEPFEPNSRGVVSMKGSKVEVAALAGGLEVTTDKGVLLARMYPGSPLEFEPQAAGATAPITVTGVMKKQGEKYYLTGENGVLYEITGKSFDSMVGKRVTITGTPDPSATPTGGASSVLVVSSARKIGAAAAGAAGAGAAGAAGAAGVGAAVGTHVAVIAGVAIAAGTGLGVGIYEATKSSASTQ